MYGLLNDPYTFINIFFAGVIMLVIAYSGIFSPVKDNYPVICLHEKLSGVPCASCGLSHSFSLIVRGRISEAYQWNIYGMRVFLFFALQLVMRFAFVVFHYRYPANSSQLIITDSVASGIMFILAFGPYMKWLVLQLVA
jgi:hypothetical protein